MVDGNVNENVEIKRSIEIKVAFFSMRNGKEEKRGKKAQRKCKRVR